jgi:diacylglycerol kinase family enzyme
VHLSKYVEIIQTEYMKINTTDTLVHIDGEPLITTNPLHIKILPKTIKIAIPYGEK